MRRRDRWLLWLKALSKRGLLPLPLGRLWHELVIFGVLQAWACLFAGVLLAFILLTKLGYPAWMPIARYDFLLLVAILTQFALLALKFERIEEAKVILIFHVVATVMELFKTAKGSWVYPEANVIRIAGVPLFSGFLYSAVGSYIARCWRLFDFRFSNYPDPRWTWGLALLIYVNFFTHHYLLICATCSLPWPPPSTAAPSSISPWIACRAACRSCSAFSSSPSSSGSARISARSPPFGSILISSRPGLR